MYAAFTIMGGGYVDGWPQLILTHGLGGAPATIAPTPTLTATSEDYLGQLIDLLPPGPAWGK